jgi:hypothetical protein
MAAPSTIAVAGYFAATRAGSPVGEATLRMKNAKSGTFSLGGQQWKVTADPATKTLQGKKAGAPLALKIVNRSRLKGTIAGDPLDLVRSVLRPIPAAELAQSDAGPTGAAKAVMDATPDYHAEVGDETTFWYAFGNVLYRGRLDGSARVLCIASDPGPSECLPFMRRTLVGDSGQKTQGFLAKLGLTRSYVLVNAFAVAMHPGESARGLQVLRTNANIRAARHDLYDLLLGGGPQAIVAFGGVAQEAYDLWAASNPAVRNVPVLELAHPAAVDRNGTGNDAALKNWAKAVTKLRTLVTPDADGDPAMPNYGDFFTETDYARIPRWDLPAPAPLYAGDDSWGRGATPRHNNCCSRPSPDDQVSLLLTPAPGQGRFLRYVYSNGALAGARSKSGRKVAVDAFGIPT